MGGHERKSYSSHTPIERASISLSTASKVYKNPCVLPIALVHHDPSRRRLFVDLDGAIELGVRSACLSRR